MKDATIYDVAKEAGVSPATVSRVLNEPSRVSQEKRDRIFQAIDRLKFVPKAEAAAVARQSLKKIGVIAPFFTQPSFMQRLRGISAVLAGRHYELVVYTIESVESLNAYIDMLTAGKRVDGLIVLCLDVGDKNREKLRASKLPVCFVEREEDGFDCAVIDNKTAGRQVAEFLYDQGFSRPGFVGEASEIEYAIPATELRLSGFREYFREKGIELKDNHMWMGEFLEKKVDEGIRKILSGSVLPDCVFASSDMIALRFMKIASRDNRTKNIAVVGFDNLDVAEYVSLTTVNQNLDESGRIAAEMILERLKDRNRVPRKIQLETRIIERSSFCI